MARGRRIWAKLEASSLFRGIQARLNTTSLAAQSLRAKVDRSTPPFLKYFSRYMLIAIGWVPVAIFIKDHVCEITTIKGPSMSPFFNERYNEEQKEDVCLSMKLFARENLQRGMIITFMNPMIPGKLTTKRIVGLPGDIVRTKPPFPQLGNGYIRVPEHHVWVEGDEGGRLTRDSNYYGPVSIRLIQGRVTYILLPFRKAGRVKWWEHPDRLAAFREQ